MRHSKVVCWEIVEINPTLDTLNQMGEAAFEVLQVAVKERQSNGNLVGA